MGFIQDEIAKYERRVKRLAENPDPSRFQSTRILYEMWRDQRREELRAWQAGEPFIYYEGPFERILLSMGFHLWHVGRQADRANYDAQRYLTAVRNFGFPDNICDRVQVGVGLSLAGEAPPPSFVLVTHVECTPMPEGLKALARHFGCPSRVLTAGFVLEVNEENLAYCVGQLEEFIQYAESSVPGIKFDEDKFIALQKIEQEIQEARTRMVEMVSTVPSPVSGRDSLRIPSVELVRHPRFLEYMDAYEKEITAKVKSGKAAVPNEQLRFMWLTSAPFYDDPFAFLAEKGVSTPLYEASLFFPDRILTWKQWEEKLGRGLAPMEKEGIAMLKGLWRYRVDGALKACSRFKIDGIVHYLLSGCPTSLGSAAILAERAQQELSVPSLMIEGWCMDKEKYNKADFEARLEDFVNVCKASKGHDPGEGSAA